jgi:hypothetical protein
MKHLLLVICCLVPFSLRAELSADFSGNLEVQGRHVWNNEDARQGLLQDWKEDDFYLTYGNLNSVVQFKNSRLEANLFARYSYSELYENRFLGGPAFATQIYTFPNRLVARDVFKLQHEKQENNYKTEAVLNKFFYEWSYEEHRFVVGRMYINYGLGEVFNPINPFNQPTGLTTIKQVAQGNDGFNFTFYVNDQHIVDFYILGDKAVEGYEGEINKTLWIHGEYQLTPDLQLDYVVGEDQKRHKLGGQVSYNSADALIFLQTLYQSDFVTDRPSHPLWDAMLGYDRQLTSLWHVRAEGGYQKRDRFAPLSDFGDRFLPSEYFISLTNIYEIHPLVQLSGTLINDIKTGFTYFIAKSTFSLGKNTEAEIFGYLPTAKGSGSQFLAQKLVTTDVGLALRTFF